MVAMEATMNRRSGRAALAVGIAVVGLAVVGLAVVGLACTLVLGAASPALAQPRTLESSGGRPMGRDPYRVFLHVMSAQQDRYNDVDRWLLDLARADGRPNELDARDFIRGMPDASVDGLLTAARDYVYRRWGRGDRSEDVVSDFLDAIARLELPPRYTVLMVYGNSDISGMRHGHLVGSFMLGRAFGTSQLEGSPLHWRLDMRSLGGESMWAWRADPYVDNRLLLYLGIGIEGMHGKGEIRDDDDNVLVPLDFFGFRLGLNAHVRYAVRPWLTLQTVVGAGFGVGTLRAQGSVRDSLGVTDPCNIDLTQIQSADDAVRCTINNSLGLYDTFPFTARVGAQLFGWLQLEALYSYEPLYVAETLIAPAAMHQVWLRLGVNIY